MKGVKGTRKWLYRSNFITCSTWLSTIIAYAAYVENWPKIIVWIMAILTGISLIAGIIFYVIWLRISLKKDVEVYYVKKPESIYDID